MKGKAIIPLVLGLGIGIFAIKMFYNVLSKAKGSTGESVQVVRAKIDIAPTMEVTDQMVEMASVPESLCPKLAFRDMKEVVGRVAANSIPQGCPVVQSLLAPKGTLAGMGARIPEGFRAVAVKVDESVGVAGWIKPGSRVDVVAVMTGRGGGRSENVSSTILQNVLVLAVGQESGNNNTDPNATVPKSVTLAVTPEQVPKLHLAATKGTLRLAMRNQYDETPVREAETTDNTNLDQQGSGDASASSSGFWKEMWKNLGNNPPKATDKQPVEKKPAEKTKVVRAATSKPAFEVEVLSGGSRSSVGFTGKGTDAKWVETNGRGPNGKTQADPQCQDVAAAPANENDGSEPATNNP